MPQCARLLTQLPHLPDSLLMYSPLASTSSLPHLVLLITRSSSSPPRHVHVNRAKVIPHQTHCRCHAPHIALSSSHTLTLTTSSCARQLASGHSARCAPLCGRASHVRVGQTRNHCWRSCGTAQCWCIGSASRGRDNASINSTCNHARWRQAGSLATGISSCTRR